MAHAPRPSFLHHMPRREGKQPSDGGSNGDLLQADRICARQGDRLVQLERRFFVIDRPCTEDPDVVQSHTDLHAPCPRSPDQEDRYHAVGPSRNAGAVPHWLLLTAWMA
jgi:hypothetical protein